MNDGAPYKSSDGVIGSGLLLYNRHGGIVDCSRTTNTLTHPNQIVPHLVVPVSRLVMKNVGLGP